MKKIVLKHPIIALLLSNILSDFFCGIFFYVMLLGIAVLIGGFLFHLESDALLDFSVFVMCSIMGLLKIVMVPYVFIVIEEEAKSGFAYDFVRSLKTNILFLPILFIIIIVLESLIPPDSYATTKLSRILGISFFSIAPSYVILYIYWFVKRFRTNKLNKIFKYKITQNPKWYYSYIFLLLIFITYYFVYTK